MIRHEHSHKYHIFKDYCKYTWKQLIYVLSEFLPFKYFYLKSIYCSHILDGWCITFLFKYRLWSSNSFNIAVCMSWYWTTKSSSLVSLRDENQMCFKSHWLFSMMPCVLLSSEKHDFNVAECVSIQLPVFSGFSGNYIFVLHSHKLCQSHDVQDHPKNPPQKHTHTHKYISIYILISMYFHLCVCACVWTCICVCSFT